MAWNFCRSIDTNHGRANKQVREGFIVDEDEDDEEIDENSDEERKRRKRKRRQERKEEEELDEEDLDLIGESIGDWERRQPSQVRTRKTIATYTSGWTGLRSRNNVIVS